MLEGLLNKPKSMSTIKGDYAFGGLLNVKLPDIPAPIFVWQNPKFYYI